MAHPLDGCLRKLKRSDRYIQEVNGLIEQFGRECEDKLIANYQPDGSIKGMDFPDTHPDLPLAISDAAHNLRGALDYLVYELAIKDSGSVQNGTQFPIEDVRSGISPTTGNKFGFDAVAPRYLKGLSPDHVAAIEKMQPYNGWNWLKSLRDISNPDKHRKLMVIERSDTILVWPGLTVSQPADYLGKLLPDGRSLHVDAHQTVKIALSDGPAFVVTTLYGIQASLMDALKIFHSEF